MAYLVFSWLTRYFRGMRPASAMIFLSRKGTRSSKEFAMLILSAFKRMSPTIHMFRSTNCILVTGSLSATMS